MARVHKVAKSAKEHRCGFDGNVIPKGQPYLWASPGYHSRTKMVRCVAHPFRESDLTTGIRGEALAAREAFEDGIGSVSSFDELEALRADLESALDDYVSTRQEALDAWENGNSQLEDLLATAEQAQQEVADWQAEYEDTSEPDDDDLDQYKQDALSDGEPFSREDLVELWLQDKLEEAKDELSDVVSGLEL